MSRTVSAIERALVRPADGTFEPAEVASLPAPVRRYLRRAIRPGAPLARTARLRMQGRIRLGRWVPFRARQTLTPHEGMVWSARAAFGLVSGFDRYLDGRGMADWKVLGLVTVMHEEGPDTDRAAAGRCGAEAIWVPTALLPRFGVRWEAVDDEHVVAHHTVGDTPIDLELHLDDDGRVRSCTFDRWGDPDGTGVAGRWRFGGDVTGYRRFGEVELPAAGRFGWHHGTARWDEGEFFRYRITAHEPVAVRP